MDISEISSRVIRESYMDKPTPNCPGGIGSFGFNSYDLLTFALLGKKNILFTLWPKKLISLPDFIFNKSLLINRLQNTRATLENLG